MLARYLSALLLLPLLLVSTASAQINAPDNKGTDFMIGGSRNISTGTVRLFIAAEDTTQVEVSGPSLSTTTVTATGGTTTSILLPTSILDSSPNLITNHGIRVRSLSPTKPIAVYFLNQASATTDAYMALPVDVLGTEYRVTAWEAVGNRPSQILLVGTEGGTSVTVTTSVAATGFNAGVPRTITLDALNTFLIEAPTGSNDLTGTLVTSTKPIAVFGGHQCGNVPDSGTFACDHMVEQMAPVSTWASEFVVSPLATRTAGDTVRILAHDPGTVVAINGATVATLNAGQYYTYSQSSVAGARITASQPVQVMQYSKGTTADGVTSDPFMMTVVPVNQYGNNYFFSTPGASPVAFSNWVNIVIKNADKGGLKLDGVALSPIWTLVAGTDYVYGRVQIAIGAHRIQHDSAIVPFGISVYGFANADSYGYAGGMRLAPLQEPCSATAPVPGDGLDNDCDDTVDEELFNGVDDDGDGEIDEDLAVVPNLPPVANAGLDQTIFVDGMCKATITVNGGGSSDPDGNPLTYSWSTSHFGGPHSGVSQTFSNVGPGLYTFGLIVTDSNGEPNGPDFVTVNVKDTIAPALGPLAPLTVTATSAAGAPVTLPAVTAIDGCAGPILATPSVANGLFPIGSTPVTYTAADASGNIATAMLLVTVVPPPLDVTSITFETRRWLGPVPASGAQSESIYFSLPVGTPGYAPGPKTLTVFAGVSNQSMFSGSNSNIGYHHHFAFNAPITGSLTVRMGADFGGGGTLIIDGQVVDFRNYDIWWNGNFNNPAQHLVATVNISAGPHVIDAYGFENGLDGPQQAEYSYLGGLFTIFTAPANEVPVVVLNGPAAAPTGSTQTFSFTVADPDPGASFTVTTASCGANGTQVGPLAATPAGGSFDCAFASALASSTVSLRVTDNLGAQSNLATRVVTMVDAVAPVLSVPADVTLEAQDASGAPYSFAGTATDDFDTEVAISCDAASGTFPLGATTVHCTATDDAGNEDEASFIVTVEDTTAPLLTVPSDVTLSATDLNGAPYGYTVTATDTVDGDVDVTCTAVGGAYLPFGANSVSCTARDDAGNETRRAWTVNVSDQDKPVITVPAAIVVEATGPLGALVSYTVTAFDALSAMGPIVCEVAGSGVGTPGGGVPAGDGKVPVGGNDELLAGGDGPETKTVTAEDLQFPLGTSTVSCIVTDHGNNTQTATFTVTVEDTTAPVVDVTDLIRPATGVAGATVDFAIVAHDIVDGDIAATCTPASGSLFAIGDASVSCEATDEAGNTGTASFTVTVTDTVLPVLTLPTAPVIVEALSPEGAPASFSVSADDNIDGAIAVTCSAASGDPFGLGSTAVDCSATDEAGNTAEGTFTVTVHDTTAPSVANISITVEAAGPGGAVAFFNPAVSDAVTLGLTATCAPLSGTLFALGENTVVCTATDAAGNTGTGSVTVNVVDTTAPVISGADVTVVSPGLNGVPVLLPVQAADIVNGAVTVTCNPVNGSLFPLGTTSVTCSAADAAGNGASRTFTVNVTRPTQACFTVDFREITYFRNNDVITSSDAGIRQRNGIGGSFDPALWPYRSSGGGQYTKSRGTQFRIYGFKPETLGTQVRNADNPLLVYPVQKDTTIAGGAYYVDLGGPARVSLCPDQLHDYVLAGEKGNGHTDRSSKLPDAQRNVPGVMLTRNAQRLKLPRHIDREMDQLGIAHGEFGLIDYIGFQLQGNGAGQFREFVDVEVSFPFDSATDRQAHYALGFHTALNTNFESYAGCNYVDSAPGNDGVRLRDLWGPNRSGSGNTSGWAACGRKEPRTNEKVRANYDVPFNAVQLLPTVSSGTDTNRLFYGAIRPAPQSRPDHKKDWRDWDDWDNKWDDRDRDDRNRHDRDDRDDRDRD